MKLDVVVVGAGMAGLICAQQLQRSGYRVVVIEKSRGLGGRVATRRLAGTWADHGLRCLEVQGDLTSLLIQTLVQQGILHRWTETIHDWTTTGLQVSPVQHPRYAAAEGITAVAKALGAGLEIRRAQRVQAIAFQPDRSWKLTLETGAGSGAEVASLAVVLAIPAPQALLLLQPIADWLPDDLLAALRSVQFAPCITSIAAYPIKYAAKFQNLPWQAVQFPAGATLAWVGLEGSKRSIESSESTETSPTLVVQSSAAFAELHLDDTDLQPVGQHLLTQAAEALLPALAEAEELQVHRWRYAFVSQPWQNTSLQAASLPLVCCGDWCGGDRLESALNSGLAAAQQIALQLGTPVVSETAEPIAAFADLLKLVSAHST
ncbi:FAD-dependent oxidoreductase [Phormidium tenue FACHB-886]|nr:FAD-dependent oxidoreductase [Phormidium tenue FACHB-886]